MKQMVLFFSTPSNLVARNISASDSSVIAATTTAGDSGNVVLTAVPDASVIDNIFSNVTDTTAVSALLVLLQLLVLIWLLAT